MAHSSERPYHLSSTEKKDLKEIFAERFDPLMDTLPSDDFDFGQWFSKHRSRIVLAGLMFIAQVIPDVGYPKVQPSIHPAPAPNPTRTSFVNPQDEAPLQIIITRQFGPLLPTNNR